MRSNPDTGRRRGELSVLRRGLSRDRTSLGGGKHAHGPAHRERHRSMYASIASRIS